MNFVHKINQYLLQRYPTIWNTRIVWMLSVAFLVHLFFFFVGYVFYTDPVSLQNSYITDDYFSSGLMFIHFIISLLILTIWVMNLLKNNAFKNFYPMKSWALFGQFVQYVIIIVANISFHHSFSLGNYLYINGKYDDAKYASYVKKANEGNVFMPMTLNAYLLDNRPLPKPFDKLYLERSSGYIDTQQPFFEFLDNRYQFYSVYKKREIREYAEDFADSEEALYAFSRTINDSIKEIFFKEKVVDVSQYVKNANPSLRNFASLLVDDYYHTDDAYRAYISEGYYQTEAHVEKNSAEVKLNHYINSLLDKKDSKAIQKILADFLAISKELKIKTSLNTEDWFKLVYHPETDFEVMNFIRNDYKYSTNYEYSNDYEYNSVEEKYFYAKVSDYFYDMNSLENVLSNIRQLKAEGWGSDAFGFMMLLWFAVGASVLLFGYRTIGLKSVLLSGITTGVIFLGCALFTLMVSFGGNVTEYFVFSLFYVVYLSVLAVAIFLPNDGHKMLKSIALYIGYVAFPMFVFVIFRHIDETMEDACMMDYEERCKDLEYYISELLQGYIILAISAVFWCFYTKLLMRWKAASE